MKTFLHSNLRVTSAYPRLKTLALFLILFLAAGNVWATEATLNSVSTKEVVTSSGGSVSKEFDGVTCLIERNSSNQPGFYTSSGIVRYYSSDVMTLSVASGSTISQIDFVMNSGSVGTASPGTLSDNQWKGSSQSVSFTGGGTVKITSITVTYSGGGGGGGTKYTVSFNVGASSGSQADIQEGTVGGGITLPAGPTPTCSSDDWTFEGWAEAAVGTKTTTAPTLLAAGSTYNPTSNCTLFAVYSKTESSGGGGSSNETITKTMTEIVSANSYTVSSGSDVTCYTSFSLNSDITVSTTGSANCGSFWGSTNQEWRLYENKSGNAIITAGTGCTLTSVSVSFSVSNTGILVRGGSAMTSGQEYTETGSSVTYTVGNSGSATNGQVRITSITVKYTKSGGGSSTTYYWSSPTCTACTNEITISKGDDPANGTFTLDNSGTVCIDGGNASTTVTASPSTHYHLATVTTSGSVGTVGTISGNTCTITGIDASTTVNVTFAADTKEVVTWHVATATTDEEKYPGETLEGITAPTSSDCDGEKVFVGWTADGTYSDENDAPADLFTDPTTKTMPAGGTDYFAVFATSGSSGFATYSFSITSGDFTGSSYDANNGAHTSTATDVSNPANTMTVSWTSNNVSNNTGTQWRKENSYIYNTTDLGKINSVTLSGGDGLSQYYGTSENPSNSSLGTSDGYFKVANTTQGALHTTSLTVNFTCAAGGTSYSDYAVSCTTYEVTATSNNLSYGTVSVNRYTITATPATGYVADGYTITSGTATVTQTGNAYKVKPSTDCTIRINFREAETYTITIIDNGKTTTETATEGVPYSLPEEGNSNCEDATLLGWATGEYTDHLTGTSTPPAYAAPDTEKNITGATTFVAVYGTVVEDASDEYTLITSTAQLNTGDYLIVAHYAENMKYAMSNTINSSGYVNESSVTITNDKILSTDDALRWHINKTGDNYTLYNAAVSKYLALSSEEPSLQDEAYNFAAALSGDSWIFESTTISGYQLSYNVNFKSLTDQTSPIKLYRRGSNIGNYTSKPSCCHKPTTALTIESDATNLIGSGVAHLTLSGGNDTTITWATTGGTLSEQTNSSATITLPSAAETTVYTITATQADDETDPDNVICGDVVTINITVKAQRTISYNVVENDTPSEINSEIVADGTTYTLPDISEDYTCAEGVSFAGWSTNQNATSVEAEAGSSPTATANTTWYAVWKNAIGSKKETRTKYVPITDDSTLAADQIVVFVSGTVGMTTISTGSYAQTSANGLLGENNSYITFPSEDGIQELTLKGTAGAWNLYTGSKYVEFGTKKFTLKDNEADASDLSISITDGLASITDNTYTIRYNYNSGNTPRFAPYTSTTLTLPSLYIKSGTTEVTVPTEISYSTNTTCSSGANIRTNTTQWITAANGQKVKGIYSVTAKGFDDAATLSVTSSDPHFTVSLVQTAVPSGAIGLTTDMIVEYMPSEANTINSTTLTLTAGDVTKTVTVKGRSLPDDFLIITNKILWYALSANMSDGASQYDGITVIPTIEEEVPIIVPVTLITTIYSLRAVASTRFSEHGNSVRLVGNDNKVLWSKLTAGQTSIQNKDILDESNGAEEEWLLTTTDGQRYTITNPNHPDAGEGRQLSYGSKFGMYKSESEFYLVPAGCTSQPQNVRVSPRRVDATFAWESNANNVTIAIYSDEEKTVLAQSTTTSTSPHLILDLNESTDYWYTLTPGADEACAVSGTFKTSGPTIEIVEWKKDTAVMYVDKDEDLEPVVVINGQQESGTIGGGGSATELFFAKYFEGAGDMKLISIYNGTKASIDLSNYEISVQVCSNGTNTFNGTSTSYSLNTLDHINAGQEIIFFSKPIAGQSSFDCSVTFLDSVDEKNQETDNPRWILCDNKPHNGVSFRKFDFSGNDPIVLINDGDTIDIIGAVDKETTTKDCRNTDIGWWGTCLNMDFKKQPSDSIYIPMFEKSNKTPVSRTDSIAILEGFGVNLVDSIIDICTARSILFRNKTVLNGDSAVKYNHDDFKTFTPYEWNGRSVCITSTMQTAAGVSGDGMGTCNSYQDLGTFNYTTYRVDYINIIPDQTLGDFEHDDETKLYQIRIPDLEKYACLDLEFQLKKEGEIVTSTNVSVPIMISDNADTNDPLFSEIMKGKVENEEMVYSQSKERCRTCNVVVLSGATLTKGADADEKDIPEVHSVKVYPGGKLVIPDGTHFTVSSIVLRREEDEVATINIQGTGELTVSKPNSTFLDIRIDPTNWHFISLPYDCNVSDIYFADDQVVKKAVLGTDYFLRWYNGAERARTKNDDAWEDVDPDGTLKKGLGYIFALPGDGSVKREFRFPMANAAISEDKEDKTIGPVFGYGCDKEISELRPNHRGWNLLGNPYLMPYKSSEWGSLIVGDSLIENYPTDPTEPWDGSWTTNENALQYIVEPINNGWDGYRQVRLADYPMTPFSSYFVQIGGTDPSEEQTVNFIAEKVQRSSLVQRRTNEYQVKNHPVWLGVTLTNDKKEKDETTLLISDKFTTGYDMMNDLVKMRGSYYNYYTTPVLASRNDEGEMAFNALPDNSAKAGVPLNYFAAAQGQYTLALDGRYSLEEIKEVQLYDSELSTWTDLKAEDYTFTSKRTDNKTRFTLYVTVERKQPQTPTATDNIYGNLTLTTSDKTLILSGLQGNAEIYVYDMSGKLIDSGSHTASGESGVWRTTVPMQGVYFVRVMTDNEAQTLNTIVY